MPRTTEGAAIRRACLALVAVVLLAGCGEGRSQPADDGPAPRVELAHLDHLGQDVTHEGRTYRIVHIYSEAPDYRWVGDDDEGVACVDDAARAAVVYLRHYELTGNEASRAKAQRLLDFVGYMQADDGLFYNFVWDSTLAVNQVHENSRADVFGWWAARAVWALGTGARVLAQVDAEAAEGYAARVRRTYPHLRTWLARYGETLEEGGRVVPRWLLYETAADATSELLLGLGALHAAYPDPELAQLIDRFSEGVARMQYGSMNVHPYGAHASWRESWHAWGNSQTQALAEAGRLETARREAEHFYPRLLVEGWRHAMSLDDPDDIQVFEQIAYDVRTVAVGLVRLYEATGEERYGVMAGLAASWFTGNNAAGVAMYDPATGRGYDGILGPATINHNAGAESTIEALFTMLEVGRHPAAQRWLEARGGEPVHLERNGKQYLYRVFTAEAPAGPTQIALVMNLSDERLELLEGDALDAFLRN